MKQIIIGVGMVLLLGAGCQKENLVAPDTSNKLLVTPVSLSELESNPAFNTLLSKAALKTGLYKAEDAADYAVLTSRISKAEFLTYEAYSFLIANPNQPAFTFDNYVIRKNHDGSVEEFILRYNYDMDAYLVQGEKQFSTIIRYDTNYKLVATNAQEAEALKNGAPALKSPCEVTITVYHETPDDGNYEWEPGAVCQHTTEGDMCNVVIEYSMFCYGGGGGNDTDTEAPGGGSPDYGAPAEGGMLPDNGGPGNPVAVMEPPLGTQGEAVTIPCPPAVNELNLALDSSLGALQLYWLANNDAITGQLNDFLAEYDYSEEAKAFAIDALDAIMGNNYENLLNIPLFNQDPYNVWRTLSQAEKNLIKLYPFKAYKIFKNREIAFGETINRFGNIPENLNGKPDAFRHAFFQAINSRDVGVSVAGQFADAHETEVSQILILEVEMDLFNNEFGLLTGFNNPDATNQTISNIIHQAILDGNLKYLKPIDYSGYAIPGSSFWDDPNTIDPGDGDHGISISTQLTPTNQ